VIGARIVSGDAETELGLPHVRQPLVVVILAACPRVAEEVEQGQIGPDVPAVHPEDAGIEVHVPGVLVL